MKRASFSCSIFFALCLLLLAWSIAGITCCSCHSSGTFFSMWHTLLFFFILAGGHVRASAGALAVHGALIPCLCVCVCLSVCLSVRYQTPFSSRHESGPSLFLSTGTHPVGGQLPRVPFSALPGQSSDRPNLPSHQKNFDFQFPFASIRRAPLRSMQWTRKAKSRSFNVQTVK